MRRCFMAGEYNGFAGYANPTHTTLSFRKAFFARGIRAGGQHLKGLESHHEGGPFLARFVSSPTTWDWTRVLREVGRVQPGHSIHHAPTLLRFNGRAKFRCGSGTVTTWRQNADSRA
jgi:hypothetical protein